MPRPAGPRVLLQHCRRSSPQLQPQRQHNVPAALARAWVSGSVLSAAKGGAAAARRAAERSACAAILEGDGAARLSLSRAVKLPASVARGGAAAQVTCHTAAEHNIYKPNAVLGTFQFQMGPPLTIQ